MALNKAKIFTVASVKGGTGKTTTLLNLAGTFSEQGKKVLIIDLDLFGSAVAASLNINDETNIYSIVNDLNNNCFTMLENYIQNYRTNIDVIPAPNDPRLANKISSKYISIILARAELQYDVILIDTNHYLDDINLVAYDYSDEILFVITNDPIDLKSMKTMVSILNDMERDNYLIILNDAKDRTTNIFNRFDIKNIIKTDIDYIIPESFYIKDINKYLTNGEILVLNKKIKNLNKKAISNFEDIATRLLKKKNSEKEN